MEMMHSQNELETQVSEARRTISSDGYPMSIGELTSIYKDGELIIRPEYQRFFRWSNVQKSRLIESILLGIPIPSIFVSQTPDGKWELVDGLQRVSTLLELQGELKGEDGSALPSLLLSATKYLPALEGRYWVHKDEAKSLTEAQRLDIKRSKIDIKIIKRESSPETKFDLFQRLNSYGLTLNAQELRSALLVAVNSEFFSWLESLARYEHFRQSVSLSERLIEERYDIELVLRFLVMSSWPEEKLTQGNLRDFARVLDDKSVEFAKEFPLNQIELESAFKASFDFIYANGAEDVFRKWDSVKTEFKGSFLNTSFEVFGFGVGFHMIQSGACQADLLQVVRDFWRRPGMQSGFSTGRSTEARMAEFVPLGRALLA
jgi:hypothetical protein